jgi:hypothetical protein
MAEQDVLAELALLRDTLQELRHALPPCGNCARVATFEDYDILRCDSHHFDGQAETPWASVARRLGW